MGSASQILKLSDDSGLLNERILFLVFEYLKWDIRTLCRVTAVSWRIRALAKRLLWRELCIHRAPRMITTLTEGTANTRIIGGWPAMAKLLFHCGGCESTRHFRLSRPAPGHFAGASRFSKTAGQSFLAKRCRGDVLYVSDPCEHAAAEDERHRDDVVGVFRGVIRSFLQSRTRDCLIRKQIGFEEVMRCPYCAARVWSMTAARLIPRRIAARKLGSTDGAVEYYVCLNGHLHGQCWLVSLSSDDDGGGDVVDDEDEDEDEDEDDGWFSSDNDGDGGGSHNHVGN